MKARNASGYTLIELLVVIAIVAVLAGLALPAVTLAINKGRETQARAAIKGLEAAMAAYRAEYNRLPAEGAPGEDLELITDGGDPLIFVLLGQTQGELNPRGEKFLNAAVASNQRNGVVMSGSSAALYDPWGRPYSIVLDGDGDHLVGNPDAMNDDPGISSDASPQLPVDMAVFSSGRDGRAHTRDDVTSWR